MKTKANALLLLSAMWTLLATSNVYAQTHNSPPGKDSEKSFMSAGAGFQGGVGVTITTYAILPDGAKEPADAGGGVGVAVKERIIHRHIETKNACYGYDLAVEPPKDPDRPRFRVSFRPLDPEWQKKENEILAAHKWACTLLSLPELPEPQMVAIEDTISLEILSNPQTGVKIVDAIKVGWEKDRTQP
jgi:hypothetical protein